MVTVCPRCAHQRRPTDCNPAWECPRCGVAYNKVVTPQTPSLLDGLVPGAESAVEAATCEAVAARLNTALRPWQLQAQVRADNTQLHVLLHVQRTTTVPLATALVYTTLQDLSLPPHLRTVTLYGLKDGRAVMWQQQFSLPTARVAEASDGRMHFDHPVVNAVALPAAMVVAMVLPHVSVMPLLLYAFSTWIHELGHAIVAWLSSYLAVPLPIGLTVRGAHRNGIVYVCLLFLLGFLCLTGWRMRRRWLMELAASLVLAQCAMTWLLSERTVEMLITFGGVGGELALSTFLIVGFYVRLPDRWRWEVWRFVVLGLAMHTFWDALWQWHRIAHGVAVIPWGSPWCAIFDEGEICGDMNRLHAKFGWSTRRIIQTYATLGKGCALILVGVYLYVLVQRHPPLWFAWRQRATVWWARQAGRVPRLRR